jgi:hypothetical protein
LALRRQSWTGVCCPFWFSSLCPSVGGDGDFINRTYAALLNKNHGSHSCHAYFKSVLGTFSPCATLSCSLVLCCVTLCYVIIALPMPPLPPMFSLPPLTTISHPCPPPLLLCFLPCCLAVSPFTFAAQSILDPYLVCNTLVTILWQSCNTLVISLTHLQDGMPLLAAIFQVLTIQP